MRVPHTIPKNIVETYRCSGETILLPGEQSRSVCAENSTWDDSVIPELRILALRILVEHWKDTPLLEELPTGVDRDALLEILPIDLPFDLIVERIPHEYYWSRAAEHRWEYNNPEDHGNSWRRLYCERHLAEYLEGLEPDNFGSQREECESLVKLVRPHVRTLKIRSLVPSKWSAEEDEEKDQQDPQIGKQEDPGDNEDVSTIHHIPFNVILPQLSEIRDLWLNFGMIYMNDGFQWRDFEFSIEDCLELGQALKNCPNMEKVSLTRSNLDQPRAAAILQGIVANNNVEEINFSHCKLGDSGAHAIGEFLKTHKSLKVLSLMNNGIGANGLAGLVHALLQDTGTPLKHLDLRLNPLRDDGGVHICALVLRTSSLEELNISGCDLGTETGLGLAEVISSGYTKFSTMTIDVSNNDLGPIAGEAFDLAMKTCTTVVAMDVRMCNFTKESECSVSESVARNRERRKREMQAKSTAEKRGTIFVPSGAEQLFPSNELGSVRSSRHPLNLQPEASLKSLPMQEGPTQGSGFTTKSILKIGSRRIGLRSSSKSSVQSSSAHSRIGRSSTKLPAMRSRPVVDKHASLPAFKAKGTSYIDGGDADVPKED